MKYCIEWGGGFIQGINCSHFVFQYLFISGVMMNEDYPLVSPLYKDGEYFLKYELSLNVIRPN
jgi:hypothetical protein